MNKNTFIILMGVNNKNLHILSTQLYMKCTKRYD